MWGKRLRVLIPSCLSPLSEHVYPPDNAMPTTPWLHISGTPNDFYDTAQLKLRTSLGDPIPLKAADTLTLYEFLLECQKFG